MCPALVATVGMAAMEIKVSSSAFVQIRLRREVMRIVRKVFAIEPAKLRV